MWEIIWYENRNQEKSFISHDRGTLLEYGVIYVYMWCGVWVLASYWLVQNHNLLLPFIMSLYYPSPCSHNTLLTSLIHSSLLPVNFERIKIFRPQQPNHTATFFAGKSPNTVSSVQSFILRTASDWIWCHLSLFLPTANAISYRNIHNLFITASSIIFGVINKH
jgi:hypothetical protein